VIGDAFGGTQIARVGRRLDTFLLIVALAAVLVPLGFLAVSNGSDESTLGHDLQSRGVRTVGTVTAAEPSNHDYFSYSFTVEGSHYSGNTTAFLSGQTVDASQLHVGQHIPVIYDANKPQRSCSCDVNLLTSTSWSNNLAPLLFVILGAAVMITLHTRRRKRQRAAG
jgi:hypothetical protein